MLEPIKFHKIGTPPIVLIQVHQKTLIFIPGKNTQFAVFSVKLAVTLLYVLLETEEKKNETGPKIRHK